jgi:FtsJ-like methyltransferase
MWMMMPPLQQYDDSNVYIFMIHKLYVDRLHTFVSHRHQEAPVSWNVLDIPTQTGVSQARRGYAILWLSIGGGCTRFIPWLSPMIRQNIAWVAPISHHVCTIDDDVSIGRLIWTSTLKDRLWNDTTKALVDNPNISLRVDCYPKSPLIEKLCRQLQQVVREMMSDPGNPIDPDDNDPFEGPLPMTMSKSKCTHRLTVVRIPSGNSGNSSYDYYWGLESRLHPLDYNRTSLLLMDLALNHQAAEELAVVPVQEEIPATASHVPAIPRPVSRAYYKLLELWEDYLCLETTILPRLGQPSVAAMDLGAAPGGWTQVLLQHMGVSTVVAVDKAQLAPMHRLRGNPVTQRLFHVPATLEHFQYQTYREPLTRKARDPAEVPPTRFSILVCDASVQWNNLLPLLLQTMSRNKLAMTWTLPAIVVLTLKLPFKTIPSLQRHVADIQQQVPLYIQSLQSILYPPPQPPISSRHWIIHLMANSDSERTLLILFQGDVGDTVTS